MGAASTTEHVTELPLPIHVYSVRAPQGVPDAAIPVPAAGDGAAEHGPDTDQHAGRRQPQARLPAARPTRPLHVPCSP